MQAKVEQKFRNNLNIPKKHITFVAAFGNERGEMAEWSIAAVLKTVEPRGSGGSNPSLSANAADSKLIDAKKSQNYCYCFVNSEESTIFVMNSGRRVK